MSPEEQVELRITVGEATNDSGCTLTGVIAEDVEVVDTADYVEPAVVEHVREEYGVEVYDDAE